MTYIYNVNETVRYDSTVQDIQRKLNHIRQHLRQSWDILETDGIYGEKTSRVVNVYQTKCGLFSDRKGTLGPNTISDINHRYNSIISLISNDSHCRMSHTLEYDKNVQAIQRELNFIREKLHMYWEYLDTDGKYGEKTKKAIQAYQSHFFIVSDRSGELGPSTESHIHNKYHQLLTLEYSRITTNGSYCPVSVPDIPDSEFGLIDFGKLFIGVIGDFLDEIQDKLKLLNKAQIGMTDNMIAEKFCEDLNFVLRKIDPELDRLKKSIQTLWKEKELLEVLEPEGKKQIHTAKTNIDTLRIQNTQKKISHSKTISNVQSAQIKEIRKEYLKRLKEFNLPGKIKVKFNVTAIAAAGKPISFTVAAYELIKDIVWDWWHMDESQFKEKFHKDLHQFIDDFIIGILAEAVVAGVMIAFGLVATSLSTILITVVACAVVALIISWFLDETGISFSKIIEGYIIEIYEYICISFRDWEVSAKPLIP